MYLQERELFRNIEKLKIKEGFHTRKINRLIMQNEKKDKKIEELTKENARLTGQLDKIRNYIKMTTGVDILEGE